MTAKTPFVILFLCFVGCTAPSKTSKNSENTANTDVDFLTQTERPDWKQMIDSGDIGYFNPFSNTLIGLDEPPRSKSNEGLQPAIELSKGCEDYVEKKGKEIAELEFVVGKNGELRQFFVLQSAGPCDKDLAAGLKQANLIPAQKGKKTKAALVHLRISFDQR